MTQSDRVLPVTVIGGYLGAGKTTLLNRLLAGQHGLRLAVIVNDFGAVNVDAGLVESNDGETIALTNGCLCCQVSDGFLKVLDTLRSHAEALDGVVIETSGVADPAQTAAYATHPGFRPAAIIVLADAERIQRLARDSLVGRSIARQLDSADVILVTKGDLAGEERAAAVAAWVKERVPAARVIAAPASTVPIDLLFDNQAHARASLTPDPERAHQHDEALAAYERGIARPRRPLTTDELRRWYEALPDRVLRVKGWVRLADPLDTAAVVQGVGRRLELTPAEPDDGEHEPLLVVLGLTGSLHTVTAPDGTPLERA